MVKYNRELYLIYIPYKVEFVYYLLTPYNQATKDDMNPLASTNSMREYNVNISKALSKN